MAPFRQPLDVVELLPDALGRAGLGRHGAAGRPARDRVRTIEVGTRVAARGARLRGEDRRLDLCRACRPPARRSRRCWTRPATAVIARSTGRRWSASCGQRVRGRPDPARDRREVPVERVADDRDRGSVLRIRELAAAARSTSETRRTAMSLWTSKTTTVATCWIGVARDLDERAVLAGDDVRRGHDEVAAARTSRSPRLRRRTPCRAP